MKQIGKVLLLFFAIFGLFASNCTILTLKSPNIKVETLSDTVEILAKLEQSKSGYALIQQLARLDSSDLDGLNDILSRWTVQEAQTVLDELQTRLKIIERLEQLVDDPTSNELHQIHPLFERALWIFGPEYETVEFTSNRTLLTTVRKLFKDQESLLSTPRRRADIVVLPDSTLGIYAYDAYDENGDISDIRKVLIVELKRGGYKLTRKELRQAEDYETELRESRKISESTIVVAFVLGSTLASDARKPIKLGDPSNTFINPKTYQSVLRQAHARTFHLADKLQELRQDAFIADPEVESIFQNSGVQTSFLQAN